jgi:hypothetical protein
MPARCRAVAIAVAFNGVARQTTSHRAADHTNRAAMGDGIADQAAANGTDNSAGIVIASATTIRKGRGRERAKRDCGTRQDQ